MRMVAVMRPGLIYLLISVISLFLGSCSSDSKTYRILVIHSYEEGHVAYPDFDKAICEEFRNKGIEADIRTFYLDCEFYLEQPEIERINEYLDLTAKWKPDIILVNEDQATYSLLKSKSPLIKQIPIVFAGVNYPNWNLIKQFPNVTGFHDKIDIRGNIKLIQSILGTEIEFYSVLDTTYIDKKIIAEIKEELKDTKVIPFTNIYYNERTPLRKQGYTFFDKEEARNVEDSFIWRINRRPHNRCYIQLKRDYTNTNLGSILISPSFTAINESFGYGEKLIGGRITTSEIQIKEQVSAAISILHGKKPSDIPIVQSQKQNIIDWEAMKSQGISKKMIPSDCKIIHMPFSERYRVLWWTIIIVSSLIVAILLIVLSYLYQREQKRKRNALYQLADEKETLALAVEGSNVYAWKVDENHLHFEQAFYDTVGLKPCDISIEAFTSFIYPEHLTLFKKKFEEKALFEKQIVQLKLDFDGKGYQWWELRYNTTTFDSVNYKTAGLLFNIQSFKDREQELENARELAEKAELKQSFLANISHEIRTPLNAIVGFSNLLTSDNDLQEEEKQYFIESINRNNDLLLKLVNDILELSRLDSGQMAFDFQEYTVAELVNELYGTQRLLVPEHLDFIKENCDKSTTIYIDKARLTQVFINLVNNATKFTTNGSIRIGSHCIDDNKVCLFVEDSGKGIPKEEQKMIFARFYKQDEFMQGTGLGLAISKAIVEQLHGEIRLQSEIGKGSRFEVILPCNGSW